MLSIFSPSSKSFKQQWPNEKTILVSTRHWFMLFVPLLILSAMSIAPFLIYLFIKPTAWYSSICHLYWFLTASYFLILWDILFYTIMVYSLNSIIVTNKRVIKNEQTGFFKYRKNELELDKIQDISIKIFGPIATILDFGDIEIQTAGTKGKFYFDNFPHPQKIKSTIMKLTMG